MRVAQRGFRHCHFFDSGLRICGSGAAGSRVSPVSQWRSSCWPLTLEPFAARLALFAVSGALKALAFHLSPVAAVLLGLLTGIGGGMVRDVLVTEVPTVLRAELYAVAALAGAAVVVIGDLLQLPSAPPPWAPGAARSVPRAGTKSSGLMGEPVEAVLAGSHQRGGYCDVLHARLLPSWRHERRPESTGASPTDRVERATAPINRGAPPWRWRPVRSSPRIYRVL